MVVWHVIAAARNHRGKLRTNNEDNFYLNGKWMSHAAMTHGGRYENESKGAFQVYAVCDGMGGVTAGELASHAAVQALHDVQVDFPDGLTNAQALSAITAITLHIHRLHDVAAEHTGTTLAACLLQRGMLRVLHVGDSRVYRLRAGQLMRLTRDHSEVQRLVDQGMMTPYQARSSPNRHLITQYIGMDPGDKDFQPTLSKSAEVMPGDRYLLCSDGLIDMVEDEAIRRFLCKARDASEAVDTLVQQALDNGGHDNVTALCFFMQAEGSALWRVRWMTLLAKIRGVHKIIVC